MTTSGLEKRKKANKVHARRRCKERHGILLTRNMLSFFVKAIQRGRAEFIDRTSLTRTKWKVFYGKRYYRVIYSSSTKGIVTVLP